MPVADSQLPDDVELPEYFRRLTKLSFEELRKQGNVTFEREMSPR